MEERGISSSQHFKGSPDEAEGHRRDDADQNPTDDLGDRETLMSFSPRPWSEGQALRLRFAPDQISAFVCCHQSAHGTRCFGDLPKRPASSAFATRANRSGGSSRRTAAAAA